jgi:hypothetical protein
MLVISRPEGGGGKFDPYVYRPYNLTIHMIFDFINWFRMYEAHTYGRPLRVSQSVKTYINGRVDRLAAELLVQSECREGQVVQSSANESVGRSGA